MSVFRKQFKFVYCRSWIADIKYNRKGLGISFIEGNLKYVKHDSISALVYMRSVTVRGIHTVGSVVEKVLSFAKLIARFGERKKSFECDILETT